MIGEANTPQERAEFWLDINALDLAEDLTGHPYHESPGLAMHLHRGIEEQRRMHLSEMCDTYWMIKWQSFLEEVLALTDFEVKFEDIAANADGPINRIIATDEKRNLLMVAKSSSYRQEETVDTLKVIGAVTRPMEARCATDAYRALTGHATIIPFGKDEFFFELDGRVALRTQLEALFGANPEPVFLPLTTDIMDLDYGTVIFDNILADLEHFGLDMHNLPPVLREFLKLDN